MKNAVKAALIAALAVAGAAACTSEPTPSAAPATTTTSTTTEPAPAPSTSVVTEVVTATVTNPAKQPALVKTDTRVGYGALKLGMTLEEAKATGLAGTDLVTHDGVCWANERVSVSEQYGVVRISLPAGVSTSTGIGVGSTVDDVKRVHPDASEYRAGLSATLDATSHFNFIINSGRVVHIKIGANTADCVMADL
ncbi:hypothetical protein SAMN05216553_12270 [Lentzea fradiae]|uniref:Uncharacterized protein n=1 Tax=Lentzea fradiae TaxID=200378 RepID=A0A1G8CGS7_9PSEU|nr:hypothetical protein [Lentzea fradiae]SDH44671.1 hypothetical protein SAMN05216553_12270 [Lentzea fradiae]